MTHSKHSLNHPFIPRGGNRNRNGCNEHPRRRSKLYQIFHKFPLQDVYASFQLPSRGYIKIVPPVFPAIRNSSRQSIIDFVRNTLAMPGTMIPQHSLVYYNRYERSITATLYPSLSYSPVRRLYRSLMDTYRIKSWAYHAISRCYEPNWHLIPLAGTASNLGRSGQSPDARGTCMHFRNRTTWRTMLRRGQSIFRSN